MSGTVFGLWQTIYKTDIHSSVIACLISVRLNASGLRLEFPCEESALEIVIFRRRSADFIILIDVQKKF